MRLPKECYQMYKQIEERFINLRPAQQMGLSLWVYGAILSKSACQDAVVVALLGLGKWHTIRQYLREWLYNGADKAAPAKTQLEVTPCFAPLMSWLLSWWESEEIALAIDPTMHKDQLNALVVSVLYRGCAIPVAWHILPANKPGVWIEPILELLSLLSVAVPSEMKVLVLTDRGLWSPRLWKGIRAVGWHPLMRLKSNTVFQPVEGCRLPAIRLVAGPGHAWVGAGTAFRDRSVQRFGTLIVMWDEGHSEPWIVLTDLPPHQAGVSWYGLRVWIELGFRALKGVGLKWQRTRRSDPERVARHWLVLAVAMLWIMAYGTRLEDAQTIGVAPCNLRTAPSKVRMGKRLVSVFTRGINWMGQHILKGRIWSRLWLVPEPWPDDPPSVNVSRHQFSHFNPVL